MILSVYLSFEKLKLDFDFGTVKAARCPVSWARETTLLFGLRAARHVPTSLACLGLVENSFKLIAARDERKRQRQRLAYACMVGICAGILSSNGILTDLSGIKVFVRRCGRLSTRAVLGRRGARGCGVFIRWPGGWGRRQSATESERSPHSDRQGHGKRRPLRCRVSGKTAPTFSSLA